MAFFVSFFEHWMLFCIYSRYLCKEKCEKIYSRTLNGVYGIRTFILRILEVILLRLEVRLPKYGRKFLFADFKIQFTALAVLLLEHRMLISVDWRYGYQNTDEIFIYGL